MLPAIPPTIAAIISALRAGGSAGAKRLGGPGAARPLQSGPIGQLPPPPGGAAAAVSAGHRGAVYATKAGMLDGGSDAEVMPPAAGQAPSPMVGPGAGAPAMAGITPGASLSFDPSQAQEVPTSQLVEVIKAQLRGQVYEDSKPSQSRARRPAGAVAPMRAPQFIPDPSAPPPGIPRAPWTPNDDQWGKNSGG